MALTAGTGGGDYLSPEEWVALGKENALVAVVVKGHGTVHMEKGPSAGKDVDRAAFDLYVLDGARRGEVHVGQDAIGRGIVVPLQRGKVGEELAYRVGVGNAYGRDYPQLNAPGDLPDTAVELFESLKASGGTATEAKAEEKTEEKVPAGVGAKSAASVTGDASGDDDAPDF